MKTPFIVFEGADGAGTTTQAHALVARLHDLGIPAIYTTEPTFGPIGAMIRANLHADVGDLNWRVMTHLFAADRCWHIENEIRPALEKGTVVVGDRFYHSTVVYQGLTGDGNRERMRFVANEIQASMRTRVYAMGDFRWTEPTMTFILDGPAEVLWDRVISRGGRPDSFERPEFHKRIVEGYKNFGRDPLLEGGTLRMINCAQSSEAVADACWNFIKWYFTLEGQLTWKTERNERHTEQWRAPS